MTMPIFYRPEMSAPTDSYSPSSDKPRQFVEFVKRYDIDVLSFEPCTVDDLYRAHDNEFVDGVLDGTIPNGFNNTDPAVAQSLLYTNGSMLAAAEHAVLKRRWACSPTSGFHHAGYDFAGGFCTFNGLMVTALALKEQGMVETVGILDCDAHYGNGTQDIIERLELDWVTHRTAGAHFRDISDVGPGGRRYLDWVRQSCHELLDCDLILYQAGADPHIRDPLGGLLSDKALFIRDMTVIDTLGRKPLAWNLAGGYRRNANGEPTPVLITHRSTLEAFGVEVNSTPGYA